MSRGRVDNINPIGKVNSRNAARIQAAMKETAKKFSFKNEDGYFYDERNFPVRWGFFLNTSMGGEYVAVPTSVPEETLEVVGEKGNKYFWERPVEGEKAVVYREGHAPRALPANLDGSASFYQQTLKGLSRTELIELLKKKYDYLDEDFFGMTRRECFDVALRRLSEKTDAA